MVFRGADYTAWHERSSSSGQTPCSVATYPETGGRAARRACAAQDGRAQDGGRKTSRGSCCACCRVASASGLAGRTSATGAVAAGRCRCSRCAQTTGSFSPAGCSCGDAGEIGCRASTSAARQSCRWPAAPRAARRASIIPGPHPSSSRARGHRKCRAATVGGQRGDDPGCRRKDECGRPARRHVASG